MNPALDPRPASRYQAVTLSEYRDRLDARAAAPAPVPASRNRVLRHVAAQLIRIAF